MATTSKATKKSSRAASKKSTQQIGAASQTTGKKQGELSSPLALKAIQVQQGQHTLYMFKHRASVLYQALSINRKIENKDEGYQRTLLISRIQSLKRFIQQHNPLPGAIIVCLDKATYDKSTSTLTIPAGNDVGWVVDGQHRLASADIAAREGTEIELPVVAFVGLDEDHQIEQFITINKEAKNVPSSLYIELLKKLPVKKSADAPKERAADLAALLKRDEESPFFQRIVTMTTPKEGQLSLVNFVRKVAPLVALDKGLLSPYNEKDQVGILSNYYKGLANVFPDEFEDKGSIFFKTVGFGALMNIFPVFFTNALKMYKAFKVSDVAALFQTIDTFNFNSWKQAGTGSQAEILAGEEMKASLLWAVRGDDNKSNSIELS